MSQTEDKGLAIMRQIGKQLKNLSAQFFIILLKLILCNFETHDHHHLELGLIYIYSVIRQACE